MHKWLPIKNSLVSIKMANSKEFLFSNEASWANFNAYKRIFNWQSFMHRVYVMRERGVI